MAAAARGIIDFRRAKLNEAKWRQYLRWTLRDIQQCEYANYERLIHARHIAGLLRVDNDNYSQQWENLVSLENEIANRTMPWLKLATNTSQEKARQLRENYIKMFGDPSDPDVQADIDKLVEHWQQAKNRRNS